MEKSCVFFESGKGLFDVNFVLQSNNQKDTRNAFVFRINHASYWPFFPCLVKSNEARNWDSYLSHILSLVCICSNYLQVYSSKIETKNTVFLFIPYFI